MVHQPIFGFLLGTVSMILSSVIAALVNDFLANKLTSVVVLDSMGHILFACARFAIAQRLVHVIAMGVLYCLGDPDIGDGVVGDGRFEEVWKELDGEDG